MACSLMSDGTKYYLDQCWVVIKGILWRSPEGNFVKNAKDINMQIEMEYNTFKFTDIPHRRQWVKRKRIICIR